MTMYWNNIDPAIVRAQADVFRHLGYEIDQRERTGLDHGRFLDGCLREVGPDESVLFVDIDCIPLNADVIERAFTAAEAGGLLGCAQASAHVDPDRIYTGPMFVAISRRTWDAIGQPSFCGTPAGDIGQLVHDAAVEAGVAVEYLEPCATGIPQWSLAGRTVFGVGTFYRGGVFHLFQSRDTDYAFLFHGIAADVLADREPDMLAYCRRALEVYARDWSRPRAVWGRMRSRLRLRSRVRALAGRTPEGGR
jgi:hypothetical protein